MKWLLQRTVLEAIKQSRYEPTASERERFEAAAFGRDGENRPALLDVRGTEAVVTVEGVLTRQPDIFAFLFGGGNAVYADIVDALQAADEDPAVEAITMKVNSPGGQVAGLFETLDAMDDIEKPVTAQVSGLAASAAFALVAKADKIIATNRAAAFGSVGIVANIPTPSGDFVTITSSEAPNKRPDVTTDEGVAAVRAELDELHALFVEAIAEGRGVSADEVNAEYGRGGTLLADSALERGMIDAITTKTATAANGGTTQESRSMDLNTLKAQHPDVFKAAVEQGRAEERDRVSAHLTLGEKAGALDIAVKAIQDGEGLTQALTAQYVAAGMNRSDVSARAEDATLAEAATGSEATAEQDDKQAQDIWAEVGRLSGVDLEG